MAISAKYPNVVVQLTGHDGNAFAILGVVRKALYKGGASSEEIKTFIMEATAGDYDALLRTCMAWVTVQ